MTRVDRIRREVEDLRELVNSVISFEDEVHRKGRKLHNSLGVIERERKRRDNMFRELTRSIDLLADIDLPWLIEKVNGYAGS